MAVGICGPAHSEGKSPCYGGDLGQHLFSSALADVWPDVCTKLSLASLAALSATSRRGCVTAESVPVDGWREHARELLGIQVPREGFDCIVPLRDALRFWLPMTRKLDMQVPVDNPWNFVDADDLEASRAMARDASSLMADFDREDVCWRKRAGMVSRLVHRLLFKFFDGDVNMLATLQPGQRCSARSTESWLFIDGVCVPCVLHAAASKDDGGKLTDWSITLEVLLNQSGFSLYHRGVQRALVVNLVSSAPPWRVTAPRCVSYMGCDGRSKVLPSDQATRAESRSQWEHLLRCGEVHALAVINIIEYMM